MLSTTLIVLIVILASLYIKCKRFHLYWTNKNVPLVSDALFLWGTCPNILKGFFNPGEYIKDDYNVLKASGYKHGGAYLLNRPIYYAVDLDLIKHILKKDFQYFTERGFYHNERDDPLTANLFAVGGEKWRNLRAKLSPGFSPGKIKTMMGSLTECAEEMVKFVGKDTNVEFNKVATCYTVDVIGSCGFGLKCNSFKFPNAEFVMHGQRTFELLSPIRAVKLVVAFLFPNLARSLGIAIFDKESTKFFMDVVRDSLKFRTSRQQVRCNLLQTLIDSKTITKEEDITDDLIKELTAQVFIFFVAGFETSSLTLGYAMFELATNPNVQERLREEIRTILAQHHGKITYDAIAGMQYLSQVVDEVLRKYPPITHIMRQCEKDYTIPDTTVLLEKGVDVMIAIMGIHHDPEYYPEPEKFDPERFSPQNKQQRIHMTYMPFGEGPRTCIGLRLGLLETKVGIIALLRDFEVSVNPKTKLPLKFSPFSFTLKPFNGIFLNFNNIS